MTGIARPLIGRDSELDVLASLLEAAADGAPRFAMVSGEPGIGKTSLLAELTALATAEDHLVLTGRATELERELPFGLVVDALDDHLDSLEPAALQRIPDDELAELASIFPSLRPFAEPTGATATASERFRAHRAVREMVERLAARRPLVLLLDDVHWSDSASVELLSHLLRRPPDAAVLVVVAFRTGREGAALAAAIETAARDGAVTRLALGPLAQSDADALVDGSGAAERARLYRESGGNPFYLLQLARAGAAADGGGVRDAEGVPAAVSAAIGAELDALPAPARAFAQAAAVAGDPFDIDVAVATAAAPEAESLDALDTLIERDLLRPDDVPRRFRFRHPLVRSAVYAATAPGLRLAAHERAAAALAARGAEPTALAHHVEQSARHGDTDAIAVLRAAGGSTAARAPASAARWLEGALRILPATAPPGDRAQLLVPLGQAYSALGRFEDSHRTLEEVLPLVEEDERVAVTSGLATLEEILWRHADARARLLRALDELPDRDSAQAAVLLTDLAHQCFHVMAFDEMREEATEAVEIARRHDDATVLASALAMLALAKASTAPIDEAEQHCEEAASLLDPMPDAELARRIDAISHLSGAEYLVDRYDAAIAHALRGHAVAREFGLTDLFPTMTQALSGSYFATGRLAEAAEVLDASVERARLTDNAVALALALMNRAYTAHMAGDLDLARRCADEALALSADRASVVAAWAGGIVGVVLLEAGDPAGAVHAVTSHAGGAELEGIPSALRANFLEILARALLETGRLVEAATAAARAEERAREFGLRLGRTAAGRATAEVALARGDLADAAERALAAAALAAEIGARIEEGLARLLAGRAFAAGGERDRAIAEIDRAVELFDACGSVRNRDRAERELRALGRTVHRRSRAAAPDAAGVASLTGRELEIARLVVDRRTNPEIAAELFLSIKTVETHLRNIFRKLGASSRVEVARIVEADGGAA